VSAIGALRDRGRRARLVVSGDEPASVLPQLNLMARVAFSISRLQDTRLGTLGGILPNLPAAQYHRDILADKLGPQVVHIPIALFNAFLSTNDESDPSVNKEIRSLRRAFDVRVEDGILRKATRFHHALRDLTRQHRLAAVAMECHTELTPLFDINPCFGFADVDRDYLIGCEGDVLATVNMLMMLFLTGKEPCLGDVYAVRDGIVTLVHCGAGCRVAAPEMVVIAEQDAPDNPGLRECRDTKMAMCIPNPPAGEITLSRLYGQGCDQLHVACGTVLDADIRDRLKIHIRLHNPDGFMEQVCGNHYVLSHGDLRPEIRLLCEWLKLRLTET
ncbi:MAG: hypothetical protein M1546_01035, partial [Chloroflexi bacterium]|nr:hypothetical protein [Chloroflexota bacterium]